MKIGLLLCDHVMPELVGQFGDFPGFFSAFFAAHAPEIDIEVFDVTAGRYPEDPGAYDGFVGTGSRYSVYDNIDWIRTFAAFVARLYAEQRKFVGVCFGHQMIAHALGGRCERARAGWGLGVGEMAVVRKKGWMAPERDRFSLMMTHLDQVTAVPPNGEVLAGNDHCPCGMMTIGDHFLGIQGHPEFTGSYLRKIMELRVERIGREKVDAAAATLGNPTDEAVVAKWMRNFLR